MSLSVLFIIFISPDIYSCVCAFSLQEEKPLYSFEDNSDYIYDVAWSPIHPAVFAAVDGNGRLDIWNLTLDIEVNFFPSMLITLGDLKLHY